METKYCDHKETKGAGLASAINRRIDALESDSRSRADIIDDMAKAAGISAGTVNGIISGDINCPPIQRLEGFADVLRVSLRTLTRAAEGDGCNYDSSNSNAEPMKNINSKIMEYKNCSMIELKFDGAEIDAMTFEGYGAFFGNMDAGGDVIQPGAFADSLSESQKSGNWPAMLLQHGGGGLFGGGDNTPIGLWTDISEDGKGLRVKGKLADTPRGREVYTLLKMTPRPAITGLSIGYMVKEFTRRTKPEEPRRILNKLDLIEISPVTFPANGKARIDAIKSIDALDGPAEAEDYLREAGLTRNEAKHLMAKIRGVELREAVASEPLANILKRNAQILRR